ncbi:MAG: Asp23/Gls24 family envelope stress response protein [Candidatus Limnocylindrales bacterium]|jgi:uncharacterized alkaline shock family protein YloU
MPERSVAGRSIVTRRAIVDIVRTAVQSSYGVTGFSDPSLGRRLLRWIGLDRPGIQLTTEDGLRLDLYVKVAFGVPVAEVARQVDSAVRYSLRKVVGVEVASMTIHVDGLGYQPMAVERAEAIERESSDLVESGREVAAETSGADQAHKTAAEGGTAPRRRRTR